MRDQPDARDLVRGTMEFLRERVTPALSGHLAFQARVAANALETVLRELEHHPQSDAAERVRLLALLGDDAQPDDTLEAMNWRLCALIREGRLTPESPGLMAHLWQTTLEKLAIDQPNYSGYRAALAMPPPARD